MVRVCGKLIGWLIIASGLSVLSAVAAERGSIGTDQGSGVWQTLPTERMARAASPGTWTARSTSRHRLRGHGKPNRSIWRSGGYRRGGSYFVGTGGYSSWSRAAPKAPPVRSSTGSRHYYGPIIRRDTCSPKVYIIDPDSGEIETYCGNIKQPP